MNNYDFLLDDNISRLTFTQDRFLMHLLFFNTADCLVIDIFSPTIMVHDNLTSIIYVHTGAGVYPYQLLLT